MSNAINRVASTKLRRDLDDYDYLDASALYDLQERDYYDLVDSDLLDNEDPNDWC